MPLQAIKKFHRNLVKNGSRAITKTNYENKQKELNEIKNQFYEYYERALEDCSEVEKAGLKLVKSDFDGTFNAAKEILEKIKILPTREQTEIELSDTDEIETERNVNITEEITNNSIMATFTFETGLKLPTLTDDKDEMSLRDFLDTIQSYHDILGNADKVTLIKFICLNRIQGKAKTRLGDLSSIVDFQTLKSELLSRCGVKETIDSLHLKLSTARQGKSTLAQFAENLDLLAAKLASLEIKRQNISNSETQRVIRETTKSQALQAFKRGIHEEIKVAVDAAQPKSLEDALKVATASNVNRSVAEINFMRRGHNNSRGNSKFRGNVRNNSNNSNNNQNRESNQNSNQRGGHNGRRNFSQRGNSRQYSNNNRGNYDNQNRSNSNYNRNGGRGNFSNRNRSNNSNTQRSHSVHCCEINPSNPSTSSVQQYTCQYMHDSGSHDACMHQGNATAHPTWGARQ